MPLSDLQRAARRRGLGGSDAAAVCGRHPYKSPLSVWMEKVWGVQQAETEAMRWGTRLEAVVAEIAAEELGMQLAVPAEMFAHPEHPWMVGNLDGVLDGKRVLEVKCVSPWAADDLGPEGTDGVLRWHLYQCHHYLTVTGLTEAVVAYLIGGQKLQLYRIDADPEFGEALIETEERFWREHVLTQEPPEESDSESLKEYLARKYPKDDGTTLTIEDGTLAMEAIRELQSAIAAKKAAEARHTQAVQRVQQIMGDASRLETPLGRITWKTTKKGHRQFVPKLNEETNGTEQRQ